jgi:nucleoside-diphosphate-sugar epimerase
VNILVLGGTGFISGALVRCLLAKGHQVSIVTRGREPVGKVPGRGVEVLTADRSNISSLTRVLGRRTFDAVYDIIAYLPEESRRAAELFRGRVGRFIHCSTVSVYMVSGRTQCPVTEDQDTLPLMTFWDRNPFGMQYGIDKRACERVLWDAHHDTRLPVSMLRPTFVSGPADPSCRDWFWIERILDGQPLLVPGSGDCAFQQVYIEDLAAAFAALLEHSASIGRAYNVVGEEVFSLNEYLGLLGELTGRAVTCVHVPQAVFDRHALSTHPHGDVFPFNTRRTAVFSLDRIKRDLGYRSTPFRQWMATTVEWWRKQGGHSLGYNRRAQEVEFLESLHGFGDSRLLHRHILR